MPVSGIVNQTNEEPSGGLSNNPEDLNLEIKELVNGLQMYQRAVRSFRQRFGSNSDALSKVDANREARRIFRVGVKIANKVEEFIKSGKMETAQRKWCEEICLCIQELSQVEGLGQIRAAELVDSGISSIDDLFCNTAKLTRQQLIGLEHFEDFKLKVPYKEAEEMVNVVKREVTQLNQNFSVHLCGSFRRGCLSDNKIDIVIKTPKLEGEPVETLKKIVSRLEKSGLITDTICLGDCKFSGACRLSPQQPARRISLRLTPPTHFPFALLFHTGPRSFIEKMLKKAQEEGLSLNEYSLHINLPNGFLGETIPVMTEEEIFEHLKLPYTLPEGRK